MTASKHVLQTIREFMTSRSKKVPQLKVSGIGMSVFLLVLLGFSVVSNLLCGSKIS